MRDSKNVVILSILAIVLVLVIVVAIAINPIIGAVLAPVLLGVAAIIHAITGKSVGPDSTKSKSPEDALAAAEPTGGDDTAEPARPDIT